MPDTLTVEYVDPDTVLCGSNIRATPQLDDAFLESVRTRGVLTPCPAVRTADGQIILVFGSRRRAAASKTGQPLPVFITGDEDTTRDGQVARLFDQFDENERRAGLTAQEKASFVQALFDFKIPESRIRKQTGWDKAAIEQARKVAASEKVMAAPPIANLEMASVIAGFEADGDTEAAAALEEAVALGPGQFRHTAQQLTDTQPERFQKRDVLAELAEAGIRVVDESRGTWQLQLVYLRTKDGERITAKKHAACPGHAAYLNGQHHERVGSEWRRVWKAEFICTDPDAGGHSSYQSRVHVAQDQTPAERQAELDKNRRTRAGNAEWRSATKVRRDHITSTIVPLPSVPKEWDVQAYRLAVLAGDTYALQYAMNRHHPLACRWLGLADDDKLNGDKDQLLALGAAAANGKAAVIELVLLLAAAEKQAGSPDAWDCEDYGYRNPRTDLIRYLQFLESTGYTLSPIEAHLAQGKRGKYKPQELRSRAAGKPPAAAPDAKDTGPDDH